MTSLPETWASRDLPILRAAVRRMDSGDRRPDLEEIRAETGLNLWQMQAGLDALADANPPYMACDYAMSDGTSMNGSVRTLSDRARVAVGTWPSPTNVVAEIVAALYAAADREAEPEQKTRIRAVADGLGGFVRDVAVAAVATKVGTIT